MKTFKSFDGLIHLLVVILSPWLWFIVQKNFLISLLILGLDLVVFLYFSQKRSKMLFFFLLILTIISVFITVKNGFDYSIFRNSALDIQQLNKRHEFYAHGLGKIYTNKIVLTYVKDFNLPLYKLQRNFFSNLDINLYFFASHPRERIGVGEFEKYLPIFLPFFLLGFLYIIYKPILKILLYLLFVSLTSAVISPYYNMGPILFFPIFSVIITIGLLLSLRKFKVIK